MKMTWAKDSFRIAAEERIFHTYKSSAMIMTYIIMNVIIGAGGVVVGYDHWAILDGMCKK